MMNVRTDIIKPPKQEIFKSGKFRSIITQILVLLLIIIAGALFFLATAGKFILPKLMQIIKMALPALTKLIPALTKIIGM